MMVKEIRREIISGLVAKNTSVVIRKTYISFRKLPLNTQKLNFNAT